MSSRTAYPVLAATAFALSLALATPAVGAVSTTTTADTSSTQANQRADRTPRTMFGTTAPQRSGDNLIEAVARQDAAYGRVSSVRLFYGGLPSSWAAIRAGVGARPVVVSFKANPNAVVAGTYDAQLSTWFATAPTDVRTWWTYWHEPEDDIERGAFTAEEYRAAWAHLTTLAAAAQNKRLRATLILMCWSAERGSGRDWHDYFVPGAIQVMGWDCYNAGHDKGRYRPPESMFEQVLEIATETALPYGVAEFGSQLATGDADGLGRAAWLDVCSAFLREHGARFATYFDSNIGVEFRLMDENSRAAWSRSVATSYRAR